MSIRLQEVDLRSDGWVATTLQEDNNEKGKDVGKSKILATPLEKLTESKINGSGVFDVLMKAAKTHLSVEFDAGRITGAEYSQVYLGALTAVLQTSTAFLLNEQQAQQINAEIGLIRQKTVTELSNTDDSAPIGLAHNFTPVTTSTIPPITSP